MNKALGLLALLALLVAAVGPAVAAVPAVVIEPKSGADFVTLYPLEVSDFVVNVENNEQRPVEGLSFMVSTGPELVLTLDGKELRDKNFFVPRLESGERKSFEVRVKAVSPADKALLRVNYGVERYTHSVSTFVEVQPNPLMVNARLGKSVVGPGEETSVFLDLVNNGKQVLSGVQAELGLPEGFSASNRSYALQDLNPAQSVLNREFKVRAGEDALGVKTLVVRVDYADERGMHSLEKSFEIVVEQRDKYLLMFLAVLFVFAVLSLIFQGREKRHKIVAHGGQAPGAHPAGHGVHAEAHDAHAGAGEHASHAPIKRKKILPHQKPFQEKRKR